MTWYCISKDSIKRALDILEKADAGTMATFECSGAKNDPLEKRELKLIGTFIGKGKA